jgi:CheY-like chemotaxis protein
MVLAMILAIYCARAVPFTQPKPLNPPPPEAAGATVLVVDDEQAWRTILGTDLRLLGYRVLITSDASEALETAQSERPDIGIIDLMLPEPLDGRALVDMLREHDLRFPVIFYTAYPVPPAQEAPGVIGYLSKAVDRADLYALIPPAVVQNRNVEGRR